MSISFPGPTRRSFAGLLGLKRAQADDKPVAKTDLDGKAVAKLFSKTKVPVKSSRLSENEKSDRARIEKLRGALYDEG